MSNNHSYDKGAQGIAATLRFWDDMPDDVVTTGLYAGEADYGNIPIQEKEGVRIAYLAYTETTNGLPTPSDAAANVIYTSQEDVIQQQIELARQQADIVVVGVHWGVEGSHTPTDAQRALGQKIADGARMSLLARTRMSSSPWSCLPQPERAKRFPLPIPWEILFPHRLPQTTWSV